MNCLDTKTFSDGAQGLSQADPPEPIHDVGLRVASFFFPGARQSNVLKNPKTSYYHYLILGCYSLILVCIVGPAKASSRSAT